MNTKRSPALQFVHLAWINSPHSSWARLNSAMFLSLRIAVHSGMKFAPNDITYMSEHFRIGYWLGASDEVMYAEACGSGHGTSNLSAAIAFEKHFGRKPVLWAEDVKTPQRLYVGAQFSWEKLFVTVTSMEKEHLIACTCKERKDGDRSTEIERRLRIPYAAIAEKRAAADKLVRDSLKKLSKAETLEALNSAYADLADCPFRHFDRETVRDHYNKCGEVIAQAINEAATAEQWKAHRTEQLRLAETHDADLERWLAGEKMDRYFDVVRLRVKSGFVETSTGQKASVSGAKSALAFISKYRKKGWKRNGSRFDVDEHTLKRIDKKGVQVGCTFIEWAEIDRIKKKVLSL